jgi:hypothetical protein
MIEGQSRKGSLGGELGQRGGGLSYSFIIPADNLSLLWNRHVNSLAGDDRRVVLGYQHRAVVYATTHL